jgi:hypothetical protein
MNEGQLSFWEPEEYWDAMDFLFQHIRIEANLQKRNRPQLCKIILCKRYPRIKRLNIDKICNNIGLNDLAFFRFKKDIIKAFGEYLNIDPISLDEFLKLS